MSIFNRSFCFMKVLTALVLFFFFEQNNVYAQNYQTYTLYMHGFTKYVVWPEEDKKGDFEIFVLGESALIAELQKMAEKKKVGDRTIKIFKLNTLKEFQKGHILFVPVEQSGLLPEVLNKIGDKSTLLITEQPGLGVKGSDINFITKGGKLAFELNQSALSKHKLKAASELTRLAIVI